MTGRYLTDMANVLRAAGCNVVEQAGWQQRARSSGGYGSGLPLCVMWHHTASGASASAANDAQYMSHNASAAPIANIMIARNGDVWVLAAGATNTNGSGVARSFSRGTVPADGMNTRAIGVEIQNTGVGQPYSQACIDAAMRTSNALSAAYGNRPTDVDMHWLYAPGRKIDPARANVVEGPWRPASMNSSGSWSLDDLRNELTRRASGGTQPTPPQPTPPDETEDYDAVAFIIIHRDTGQPALVYGDGRVTGIDGTAFPAFDAKYGPAIVVEPATFDDFASK